MHCPICRLPLAPVTLEPGLPAHRCEGCSGHWVEFADYAAWRTHTPPHPLAEFAERAAPVVATPNDAVPLKRCPECDHFMARYQVGHGIGFALEQCRFCRGIWLDGSEWELLKQRSLHDDLHDIFSEAWQHWVKAEQRLNVVEANFSRRLGEEAYEKAREFKTWLDAHPKRSELYAYLGVHDGRRGDSPRDRRRVRGARPDAPISEDVNEQDT